MSKYTENWKGFDRGREAWLQPHNWISMLNVLSKNIGEHIRDPNNQLYSDLLELDNNTSWISNHDPTHNFFRDYQTPWTLTGVLKPTKDTKGIIELTDLGKLLADKRVSQRAVMIQAMATYTEEGGDQSFAVIASAFLETNNRITLKQIFHSIVSAWRPGDNDLVIIDDNQCPEISDATTRRRLRSILNTMTLYDVLKHEANHWYQGDSQLLESVATGQNYPFPESNLIHSTHKARNSPKLSIDSEIEEIIQSSSSENTANPNRVLREIAARRGQSKFRNQLLGLYGSTCAVTNWDSELTLEAAHIVPVAMDGTNDVSNGILLRSDIHTLFDFNCLAINPESWEVCLSPLIKGTKYSELEGSSVNLPASLADYPNRVKLRQHLDSLRIV